MPASRAARRSRVIKRTLVAPLDGFESGYDVPHSLTRQLLLSRTVDLQRKPSGMAQHHSLQAFPFNNSFPESTANDSPIGEILDQNLEPANENDKQADVTEISPETLARRVSQIVHTPEPETDGIFTLS